ncbi:hypothetical protein I4U23_024070 [Adineta vaga]|nr:hypothetical protein I4U23_024070 [Adineta vaga]
MALLSAKQINFHAVWPSVLGTIRSVMNRSQYGLTDIPTWQSRFFDIYDLCSARPDSHAETLYNETKTFLEEHCKFINQEIIESEQNLLSIYFKYWTEYNTGATYLDTLYLHLNNLLVKKRPMIDRENYMLTAHFLELDEHIFIEIGELALESWIKVIIEPLKDRLVRLLLEQIHLDRIGECVNQTTVKGVIMSFVDVCQHRKNNPLEIYEISFEVPFLQETGEYYQKEADRLLLNYDCIQYMRKILCLIDDEEFRSRKYLNSTSYPKTNHECLQRLVCDHLNVIIKECDDFILKENLDALRNMYKLLKPTHTGVDHMVKRLEANISELGHERIQDLSEDNLSTLFVQVLLEIHTKYTNIIHEIFANDPDFISALDKACASIVNMKGGNRSSIKAPELLAHYCDSLLRKSSKTSSDSELEEKLLNAITIFNYLDDKDYFQRFYQKMLARRLISQQSSSMDGEEFMVTKLKEMCGYEFTAKLARMFQDIKVSEDLYTKFLDYLKSESCSTTLSPTMTNLLGFDCSIYILQANSWPITQPPNNTFAIPQLLERPIHLFESFYNKQYNGRKLFWLHNLSNVDVRLSYLDRPYIVTMGTYQLALLLLFNDHQELMLDDIKEATKLNRKELEKQILILVENKLLLCDSKDLKSQSIISINMEFKSKRTKFKISTATQKEMTQEIEIAEKAVDEDRRFYLQAIIVRIMKARQMMNHNHLIQEVCVQAKQHFTPSIPLIKKSIEILIDKQYIERSSSDEYSYIA